MSPYVSEVFDVFSDIKNYTIKYKSISSIVNFDNIKFILNSNYDKNLLNDYIINVFQYAKPLVTKDNYKYDDTFSYDTYKLIIENPRKFTLTELLKVYVILSDEYNNTNWTNFCCINVKGDLNIFCNNCVNCKKCVYCNNCDDCNDCKFSNHLSDCLQCDTCNNCDTCNECTCINNKNNRYKINK